MMRDSVAAIARALHGAGVRYLVAGGLAVNVHGYLRFTKDVDIVLAFDEPNATAAFDALATLGFRPVVPVTAVQFADATIRNSWVVGKNMQVLQLWSARHPQTPVDLFVTQPFDFESEYEQALVKTLGEVPVRFVSLTTLIGMKESVGREQDRVDVEHLRMRLQGTT